MNMKDNCEMIFTDAQTATDFFKDVCDTDIWRRVYSNELEVIPIDNAPILMDEIRTKMNINPNISDDSIRECMETLNLGVTVPDETHRYAYPLGETALSSLVQRAGFQQSPVLINTTNKVAQSVMSPMNKAAVLNMGFEIYKNSSLVLIRDEKVRAVLSGDENDYSILRYDKLHEALEHGLSNSFTDVKFSEATASHSYFTSVFQINDKQLNNTIENAFSSANIDINGMTAAVKLVSSDIGISGANIYPLLRGRGTEKLIGLPLILTHKNKHSVADFEMNVSKTMAMFRECEEKIKAMSTQKVKNPAGCLLRIAKQVGLSKKLTCEAAPDFEDMYGNGTLQIDVYWKLFEILDDYIAVNNVSKERQMQLEEGICRIAFGNMADYDMPFQWE